MTLLVVALVLIGVTALTVSAMLIARRHAPEGSRFQDGDRAAGVFGVLATGFAVLLGLIVFLAFERYDEARNGSEAEALAVLQQYETAQFLPAASRDRLSGELVCYGRSVVHQEWPEMEDGAASALNPWGIRLFRTIKAADPAGFRAQTAYAKWLDQTSEREEGRRDRTHGAEGVIPASLWAVLLFIAGVIFVFMLFFADPAEGAVTQGMMMGSVTAVITITLLLLVVLDNPYRPGPGSLRPVAMERALATLDEASAVLPATLSPPCTDDGAPG